MTATDYYGLRRLHEGRRFYATRKVGNNTYSHLTLDAEFQPIDITLHGHNIVRLFPNGAVMFNECGWATVTTRNRINQFLPGRYHLNQRNYDQILHHPDGTVVQVPSSGWVLVDWYSTGEQPTREALVNLGYLKENGAHV
jgi:hypothetical protein